MTETVAVLDPSDAHVLGGVVDYAGYVSDPAAPSGGVQRSGLGREGGRDGVAEFLETKYLAVEWGSP